MFYDDMAVYYSELFPVDNKAVFIHEHLEGPGPLLDVGCSDGAVAHALAEMGCKVDAIDLNPTMIALARKNNRYPSLVHYEVMNMLSMPYRPETFSGLYCIGNTLVHLKSGEILQFLKQAHVVLKPGGTMILQILNYSYVMERQLKQLPLIENQHIHFERLYNYRPNHIDFITRLTDKTKGLTFENSMPLYPLYTEDLVRMLETSGFSSIQQYGSFAGAAYKPDSLTSIIVCQKDI